MKKSFAILTLGALFLTGCSSDDDIANEAPPQDTFEVETKINLEGAPVFEKFDRVPDSWSKNAQGGNNPSFKNNTGNCAINVSTDHQEYTGMDINDFTLSDAMFLTNYAHGIDSSSAVKSSIQVKNFLKKEVDFVTYTFEGQRVVPNEDETISTKDTKSFVAIRGFNQPIKVNGKKITPIVKVDVTCTEKNDLDLNSVRDMIENMKFTYATTEEG